MSICRNTILQSFQYFDTDKFNNIKMPKKSFYDIVLIRNRLADVAIKCLIIFLIN